MCLGVFFSNNKMDTHLNWSVWIFTIYITCFSNILIYVTISLEISKWFLQPHNNFMASEPPRIMRRLQRGRQRQHLPIINNHEKAIITKEFSQQNQLMKCFFSHKVYTSSIITRCKDRWIKGKSISYHTQKLPFPQIISSLIAKFCFKNDYQCNIVLGI